MIKSGWDFCEEKEVIDVSSGNLFCSTLRAREQKFFANWIKKRKRKDSNRIQEYNCYNNLSNIVLMKQFGFFSI